MKKIIITYLMILYSTNAFSVWHDANDFYNENKFSATPEGACELYYEAVVNNPIYYHIDFSHYVLDPPNFYACYIYRYNSDRTGTLYYTQGFVLFRPIPDLCPAGTTQNPSTGLCDTNQTQKSTGKIGSCTGEGNPCDAATGNKFQTEIDHHSSSLSFVRYYNSLHSTESSLGKQWTHSFLASLTIEPTLIKINRPDGKVLEFIDDNGQWAGDADITSTLTQIGGTWQYKTSNDSIETYNESGQLLTVTTRDGKTTEYVHTNDLLEQVTGPYGRTFGFTYDESNRLITLTTPENTDIHYTYDNTDNLISVTYPDSSPGDLSDNPTKQYHYDEVVFPHHLTGITDENGHRYATWTYNRLGLAASSEHTNGVEKVELEYNNDETTTVTDASGRIKTYTFESHYGLRKPKTIQYSYNDGQQLITKQKTFTYYPENGRVKEITDYNGSTTYYAYNNRGLITLETQAKGTLEEYTVTTTWHPSYRLPATRTYPDRAETYTYNANGQLIHTQTSTVQ